MLLLRNILYRKGKATEMLVNYEPWYALFQLNGGNNYTANQKEKTGKGIFPASCGLLN